MRAFSLSNARINRSSSSLRSSCGAPIPETKYFGLQRIAYRTDVALGDAVRATNPDDEEFAGCSAEGARLKF